MVQKDTLLIGSLILAGFLLIVGCIASQGTGSDQHQAGITAVGTDDTSPGDVYGTDNVTAITDSETVTAVLYTDENSCEYDLPTFDSIEGARAGLATGAASVDVSPGGCIRYTVTSAGAVTIEELLYGSTVAARLIYDMAGSTSERDADLDGFFEWHSVLAKGTEPDEDQIIEEEYDPATKKLTIKRTYTRNGDEVHVVVEAPDESGLLAEVWHYDIPSQQPGDAGLVHGLILPNYFFAAQYTFDGCSTEDKDLIKKRLIEALYGDGTNPGGIACLNKLGAGAQEKAVIVASVRPIDISCDPSQELTAYYDVSGWFDSTKRTELHINPNSFKRLDAHEQKHLLFHEMLHSYSLHETDPKDIPRVVETDPTEACAETCWPDTFTTKCSCATCLRTNVCDPRCAGFRECDPVLAFRCPCPFRPYFYPDCSSCLAVCPSGLKCFGMATCTPVSVECGGAKTRCP